MLQRSRAILEGWLFAPLAGGDARSRLRRLVQYAYALLRDLLGGRLNLHAMGLVYATLLALIPLVAFSFAILKVFGAHRELEPLIYEFFRPMGAAASGLTVQVMDFADRVRGGLVGAVGLGLLIWTLIGTLKKVEDSLNFVWHVEVPRGFMRRIAEYLALLVVAPLLIGALIGMARTHTVSSSVQLLSAVPLLGQLVDGAVALMPLLVIGGAFALVYALIPNTRVRPLPAAIGGLAAGMAWASIGRLFTTFVVNLANLTIVYAGFAIFVTALIWIYFSWLILLLGAQLSFYVQNPSYLRIGLREPRLSNAETEQLALSIMLLIARSHLRGGGRWTVTTLATELQLPGIAVTRSVDMLEAAGLLVTTDADTLLPARDAGRIRIRDVLDVARTGNSLHGDLRSATPPAVLRLCAQFDEAWQSRLADLDLETLANSVEDSAPNVIPFQRG